MPMSVVYTNFCGMLVHENRGGTEMDYVGDPLGSCTRGLLANGTEVFSTDYWPNGEIRTSEGANPSPFGFAGLLGYFTDFSRVMYVRARYYLARYGRWLSVDPFWPRLAAYTYCRNNPTLVVDPFGLRPHKDFPYYGIKEDLFFSYGNYCGQRTVQKPYYDCDGKLHPVPTGIDCIDKACRIHDDCLANASYWGFSGLKCNCALFAAALYCSNVGCLQDNDINYDPGWTVIKCLTASKSVELAFMSICSWGAIAAPVVSGIEYLEGLLKGW